MPLVSAFGAMALQVPPDGGAKGATPLHVCVFEINSFCRAGQLPYDLTFGSASLYSQPQSGVLPALPYHAFVAWCCFKKANSPCVIIPLTEVLHKVDWLFCH